MSRWLPIALLLLSGCRPHDLAMRQDAGARPDAGHPHSFGFVAPSFTLTGKTVTGTYTIGASDPYTLYYADTSLNPVIINLPPCAFAPITYGQTFYFADIKQNAGNNTITLTPAGADKINGIAGNYVISATGSYTIVTTDAAGNWYADAIASLNPASYIAFGPNPPTQGQIRFSYPFNIYSTPQTGGASTVLSWMRAAADDSVTLGGPGANGLTFTTYKPNTNSDRNISLQIFNDSTQPTKDYIGLGGPDPTNVNGTNPVASGGFIRIPTGGFMVIEQRNPTNNGSFHIINTSGGTRLGDMAGPGNTFVDALNNIFFEVTSGGNLHIADASADWITLTGGHASTAVMNFASTVTSATIGYAATSTASGGTLSINGQNATGASNNGGNLNLGAGTSGSATQGTVNLQGGGSSLLTVGDTGLHLRSTSVAITTGTATLTAAQYQFPYIILTGSLTGNVTVVFPTTVGAQWTVDASAVTLNAHTITLQANAIAWATTVTTANLYQVTYGGSGKLYGVTLAP